MKGKIKYFSFRSFTPFMSREIDAPESQCQTPQEGAGQDSTLLAARDWIQPSF